MSAIGQRMKTLRIEMSPDVGERHLAAVARELRDPRTVPVHSARPSAALRRLASLAVAAVVVLVPVAALGAERTVPGDLLYPVKQTTEWVRSLADPDVRRIHRVQELEIVIARGAPMEVVRERLADASEQAEGSPELMARVDRAREQLRQRYGGDEDENRGRDRSGWHGSGDTGASIPPSAPVTTQGSGSLGSGQFDAGQADPGAGQADPGKEHVDPSTTLAGTAVDEPSPGTTTRSQERDRSGAGGMTP